MTRQTDARNASDTPQEDARRPLSAPPGLLVRPLDGDVGSCSGGFCALPGAKSAGV